MSGSPQKLPMSGHGGLGWVEEQEPHWDTLLPMCLEPLRAVSRECRATAMKAYFRFRGQPNRCHS